jgi:uncharacterized repeat protein (TIGR01451 family)
MVEWTLQLRNGGDGVAHRVAVSIALPDSVIYVPNSTTVNDVPIRDAGALPPFAADGISLNEVDPGVEPTIRWQIVVHNAQRSGTPIVHVAHVRYDEEHEDEIVSSELVVRSGPVFANAIPGLPFGLDGVLGPSPAGAPQALTQDRFLELPPATPVTDGNGAPYRAQLTTASPNAEAGNRTATLASFTDERVARTLRFLREARFEGLVSHLFALRAFLPDAIGDAHCGALEVLRDALREEFDRLFIKLRLPRYTIVARDIETPSLRAIIDRLLDEASLAHGAPPEPPIASIELRGSFSSDELRALYDRMLSSELASAPPWAALARLLPDETAIHAEYRARLIERLDAFSGAEAAEFVEALQRQQDAALDGALDAMCASLHAIA